MTATKGYFAHAFVATAARRYAITLFVVSSTPSRRNGGGLRSSRPAAVEPLSSAAADARDPALKFHQRPSRLRSRALLSLPKSQQLAHSASHRPRGEIDDHPSDVSSSGSGATTSMTTACNEHARTSSPWRIGQWCRPNSDVEGSLRQHLGCAANRAGRHPRNRAEHVVDGCRRSSPLPHRAGFASRAPRPSCRRDQAPGCLGRCWIREGFGVAAMLRPDAANAASFHLGSRPAPSSLRCSA